MTDAVVMEHVRGLPLGTTIRRCRVLPLLRAADIACQILAGLEARHAAGVAHGGITSATIIVAPRRDGSDQVTILDFDRVEGATPTSDLYATGVLLYEMITGKTPFDGNADPVSPSLRRPDRFIPAVLENVIMKALDREPSRRHASAAAFAAALLAATPTFEPTQISHYDRKLPIAA